MTLLLVTAVWGATFVLVQDSIRWMPFFTFLSIRFLAAGAFLAAVAALLPRHRRALADWRLWTAGLHTGFWLFAGYALQTAGLLYTSAGEAGFLTGLYVILVPIFSLTILRQIPGRNIWAGILLAALGLYFMALGSRVGFNIGDVLEVACAVAFALQILVVARHSPRFPALPFTAVQLLAVGALSALCASAANESMRQAEGSFQHPVVLWALLICTLFATLLAYFVQAAFQKFTTASHTALVFSAEPVFAALAALLWAGERLTPTELSGCALILSGMLVAEFGGRGGRADPKSASG